MAGQTYFANFNQIQYSNNTIVDITERVVDLKNMLNNPYIYYPVDISQGVRPDMLAYTNYSDPYTSWLIYLSNNIIDPYYDWYLTNREFNNYIKDKYGSVQSAMLKVSYYINNYVDQPTIQIADFNALTPLQKTYYEPNYYGSNFIVDYSRRKEDWKASTNFILSIGYTGNSAFIPDEVVNISYISGSSGRAQVVQSNSSVCIVQHIYGDAYPAPNNPNTAIVIGGSSYMYGTESGSNVTITSCSFVANNIPADVQAYYTPITYYNTEVEKNEGNKIVNMLQPTYVPGFIKNFKDLIGA